MFKQNYIFNPETGEYIISNNFNNESDAVDYIKHHSDLTGFMCAFVMMQDNPYTMFKNALEIRNDALQQEFQLELKIAKQVAAEKEFKSILKDKIDKVENSVNAVTLPEQIIAFTTEKESKLALIIDLKKQRVKILLPGVPATNSIVAGKADILDKEIILIEDRISWIISHLKDLQVLLSEIPVLEEEVTEKQKEELEELSEVSIAEIHEPISESINIGEESFFADGNMEKRKTEKSYENLEAKEVVDKIVKEILPKKENPLSVTEKLAILRKETTE